MCAVQKVAPVAVHAAQHLQVVRTKPRLAARSGAQGIQSHEPVEAATASGGAFSLHRPKASQAAAAAWLARIPRCSYLDCIKGACQATEQQAAPQRRVRHARQPLQVDSRGTSGRLSQQLRLLAAQGRRPAHPSFAPSSSVLAASHAPACFPRQWRELHAAWSVHLLALALCLRQEHTARRSSRHVSHQERLRVAVGAVRRWPCHSRLSQARGTLPAPSPSLAHRADSPPATICRRQKSCPPSWPAACPAPIP